MDPLLKCNQTQGILQETAPVAEALISDTQPGFAREHDRAVSTALCTALQWLTSFTVPAQQSAV